VFTGAAFGVYWLVLGRPVLAGDRSRDFGTVELDGRPARLEHTFVLTNRTRRQIEIEEIRSTCGCAVADLSTRSLEPGDAVEVVTALTLEKEGRKAARIYLTYGGGDRDVLRLEGAARNRQRLTAAPGPATLEPGGRLERLIFYLDYDTNDPPAAPRIAAPDGLRAEFTGWTQMTRLRKARGLPARWRGEVALELTAWAVPDRAVVIVQVGTDQKVEIALAGPSQNP
jgi:hypothetical protein